MDPTTRVTGYIERRIVSREVGRKGDLRAAIFLAGISTEGMLEVVGEDLF
jgi:hypothetical protein